MKKLLPLVLCLLFYSSALAAPTLLYQGHGSLRIITEDNKVIYIDPYAGEGYDLPADLILVSHGHPDHNAVDLIASRSDDCQVIYPELFMRLSTAQKTVKSRRQLSD